MQTKAKFRLICANITAAEKETAREIADDARVPVKSHLDVISATSVLNVLPTLAVVEEAALTPNELKAYELALLEPIEAGKIRFCAVCGQEMEEGATMCSICGTEIGKFNEAALLEEIPIPFIPKFIEMNMLIPSSKQSNPNGGSLHKLGPKKPEPNVETDAAMSDSIKQKHEFEQSELEMAALEAFVAVEGARAVRAVRDASDHEKNIDNMNEKDLYNLLAESTARLKPLLHMAKEQNVDIRECKQLLSEVVVFSKNKETKKAVTAIWLGEKSLKGAIKLKFLRNISLIENNIAELRSAWVGVARAQKLIICAKDFLKTGDYLEVPMNLEDAKNGLEPFRMTFSQ